MNSITLYRPVGLKELELIAESNWTAFPPRLEWQPIFYPVLNRDYAIQIAHEWNTGDAFSGYAGIVTQFKVSILISKMYKVENVGGEIHNELWVPAEELPQFNKNIIGNIAVTDAFFGDGFLMPGNRSIREVLSKFKQ